MTRKDFQIIANGIFAQKDACMKDRFALVADRDQMPVAEYQQALASIQCRINMLDRLADGYATTLASTNPRFDRTRFLEACGF